MKYEVGITEYTYRGRDEIVGAYTATLYVMVTIVNGVAVHPHPKPCWAYLSIMMECAPESGRFHSVYSVVGGYFEFVQQSPDDILTNIPYRKL
jgi:hypothetical protein